MGLDLRPWLFLQRDWGRTESMQCSPFTAWQVVFKVVSMCQEGSYDPEQTLQEGWAHLSPDDSFSAAKAWT